MKFETLTEANYEAWDGFCDQSDEAWLWHTSHWLEYQRAYRPDLRSRDLSFTAIDHNGEHLAICPLFVEETATGVRELSFGGSHLPSPALANGLTAKRREAVLKIIFAHIDELAREHGAARCSFRIAPLAVETPDINFLVKYGYLDASLYSQLIDTSRPLEELRKELRKGHASDVKRGLASLELTVFDQNTTTAEIFKSYQALHTLAAGRSTRPQRTFDLMHQMIQQGRGVLIAASKAGKVIGYSLVLIYKNRGYYASAANDPAPEYDSLPIAHAIQWTTIEWFNAHGHLSYEIGWQHFGNQLHDIPSAKELNLSRFKRGFGGRAVPLFIGEKYFDGAYCEQVLSARVKNYVATLTCAPATAQD